MIFQDPFGSLNPRMTVGQIVGEPLLDTTRHRARRGRWRIASPTAERRSGSIAGHAATAIRTPSPAASGSASASPAPSRSIRS